LTRQLLAFSRRQPALTQLLDLNEQLREMSKLLRPLLGDDLEIVLLPRSESAIIEADPGQLDQIVMNLAVNARDAMPRGGKLVLETGEFNFDESFAREHPEMAAGRYVMLAVSDSGIGMNEATRSRVFEPFFTTKETSKGSGLGLATVYGIVKQSGGHILVYSEPGMGTTFKIYLPRLDEVSEGPSTAQAAPRAQRGTETILIVEDEEAVRELIQTVLTEKGFDVIPSLDPQHAEKIAAEFGGEIHLLLTDMVMPGMSGRELAERISAKRRDIRVLFMSGYTESALVQDGMLSRNTLLLQKPFTVKKVLEAIRQLNVSARA